MNGSGKRFSSWSILLAVALSWQAGCSEEQGETCIANGSEDRCDGNTRVWCRSNPNNLSSIQRDPCTVCIERNGQAACVEESAPCAPSSYTERCGEVLGSPVVIRCAKVFGEETFPVSEPVGCSSNEAGLSTVTSCNPDRSVTRSACADNNLCYFVQAKSGALPACVTR